MLACTNPVHTQSRVSQTGATRVHTQTPWPVSNSPVRVHLPVNVTPHKGSEAPGVLSQLAESLPGPPDALGCSFPKGTAVSELAPVCTRVVRSA